MNTKKEEILKRLKNFREKQDDISVITDAIEYIANTPCIHDKATVVQLLACYKCQTCDDDFDPNKEACINAYAEAEFFYERMILDEHDEEFEAEPDIFIYETVVGDSRTFCAKSKRYGYDLEELKKQMESIIDENIQHICKQHDVRNKTVTAVRVIYSKKVGFFSKEKPIEYLKDLVYSVDENGLIAGKRGGKEDDD